MNDIEHGFIMRSVESEKDIERVKAFHTMYNNKAEGLTCECLLQHHPGARWDEFILMEDEKSGQIVASVCLIPWELSYGEVCLKTAMLEMVLSHPEYRNKGLIRRLIGRFHQIVEEQRYDLVIIWGIPYYYRQYGYTYCLDGFTAETIACAKMERLDKTQINRIEYRPATIQDISTLITLYEKSVQGSEIYVSRNASYWKYLIRDARFPVYMVEDGSNRHKVDYIVARTYEEGKIVHVLESSMDTEETVKGVLNRFNVLGVEKLRVEGPRNSLLVRSVREMGSHSEEGGQWLFKICNMANFLKKLAGIFERRMEQSPYAGTSRKFVINLYREAYTLWFEDGRLKSVLNSGFIDSSMGADGGDLCIPRDAFVRLALGYRNLTELGDAWPDIVVKAESREWVYILFPKIHSYIHMPYHYQSGSTYLA